MQLVQNKARFLHSPKTYFVFPTQTHCYYVEVFPKTIEGQIILWFNTLSQHCDIELGIKLVITNYTKNIKDHLSTVGVIILHDIHQLTESMRKKTINYENSHAIWTYLGIRWFLKQRRSNKQVTKIPKTKTK